MECVFSLGLVHFVLHTAVLLCGVCLFFGLGTLCLAYCRVTVWSVSFLWAWYTLSCILPCYCVECVFSLGGDLTLGVGRIICSSVLPGVPLATLLVVLASSRHSVVAETSGLPGLMPAGPLHILHPD